MVDLDSIGQRIRSGTPEPEPEDAVWLHRLDRVLLSSKPATHEFLHTIVYPHWFHRTSFIVEVHGSRDLYHSIEPVDREHRLELYDIARLLQLMASRVSLHQPDTLDGYVQTPIESRLAEAMACASIEFKPQAKVGRYRLDFLVGDEGRYVGVEADGAAFHDPLRDAQRDRTLQGLGVERVLRFPGSRIIHNADGCAREIAGYLTSSQLSPPRYALDSNLDESQENAAHHVRGPARVLAPAGSGKTKTMVNHVLVLLNRGIPGREILVLAFNKKAQEQLEDQLRQKGVVVAPNIHGEKADGVMVATFNAFGFRYLKQVAGFGNLGDIGDGMRKQRRMASQAIEEVHGPLGALKLRRGSDIVDQFLKSVARVKCDLADPATIPLDAETYDSQPSRSLPFQPLFDRFMEQAFDSRLFSFDDQIYLTLRDLYENSANRRTVQERFSYVLVDEFQDLNAAQLELVEIVSRPERNIYGVGDDDQLIYGWRFAKPENILGFEKRYASEQYTSTYTLNTNYRCSRAVVDASTRCISKNTHRVAKDIRAVDGAPEGRVAYFADFDWAVRSKAILEFVRGEQARTACKWRDIAILSRYKSVLPVVALSLDRAGIPRSPLLRHRLFSDRRASVLRAYYEIVLAPDQSSGEVWASAARVPNRYVANTVLDEVASRKNGIEALEQAIPELNQRVRPEVVGFLNAVRSLNSEVAANEVRPTQLVRQIVERFNLLNYWTDSVAGHASAEADDATASAIVGAIEAMAAEFDDHSRFLEYWEKQIERESTRNEDEDDTLKREIDEERDAIVLGTIHSAKGREYRSVVIVDYDTQSVRTSESDAEEERRVLYVGMTRARESLLFALATPPGKTDPYVIDTIRPPKTDEKRRLAGEIDTATGAVASARERVATAERWIAELDNGAAYIRLRDELEQTRAELQSVRSRYTSLVESGWWVRLWDGLLLHISKSGRAILRELSELRTREEQLSGCEEERRTLVQRLEYARDEVVASAEETHREALQQLAIVSKDLERLTDRQNELRIWNASKATA